MSPMPRVLSSDRGSVSHSQRQQHQAGDASDRAPGEQAPTQHQQQQSMQQQQQHHQPLQEHRPMHARLQQHEEEEEDEQEQAYGDLVTEEAALGNDDSEEEEEEEREKSSLFRKMRSMWLGSRQGSIFLKKKFVTFKETSIPAEEEEEEEEEEEGAHAAANTAAPEGKAGAASGGGACAGSAPRKSISGTRAAVLGSRRGSISVKPKGVKFDVGTATMEEYLETTGKTGAESGGVKGRPSMSAVRAALLGSKRGSISVRPKGVKFDVDTPTMEEYLETTKGTAASGGANSRRSLSAVRAALLGSKRGSISVRPKEVRFDKDTATMDEYLQASGAAAAESGAAKGRPSLSAVRAALLGSKRGSMSVRPKCAAI